MVQLHCSPEPLSIMGVSVTPFASYQQAIDCVAAGIRERSQKCAVAINPEKIMHAKRDSVLRSALNGFEVGICDGVGVAIAARLLYGRRLRRCTGVDLFLELVRVASVEGWSVFLYGASPESNEGARAALLDMYPTLRIAGTQHGYETDDPSLVARINESKAELLFVALGSPKQEYWIARNRASLAVPFCMGVGGSFDVLSGKAKRAPRFFRRTGTEFLFRLMLQPARLVRQTALPLFMFGVLRSRFHQPAWRSVEIAEAETKSGAHDNAF